MEYFTRRLPSTPCNVFADSVATAEGYNDQNKQGCNLDNQLHYAARYCDQAVLCGKFQSKVRL